MQPEVDRLVKADFMPLADALRLANEYRLAGRLPEARALCQAVLKTLPNQSHALHNLGLVARQSGNLVEAEQLLRRAFAIDRTDMVTLLVHLGITLLERDQTQEAAAAAAQAFAFDPNHYEVIHLLGAVALARGELEAALAHFRRALELKPDHADAYHNIGHALRQLGRFDEALAAYRKARAIDPNDMRYHYDVADTKKFVAGDADLQAMQKFEAAADRLTAEHQIYLHFALGKAYADVKEHARAFEHLLKGNALKRVQVVFDESTNTADFKRVETVFTPALIKKKARDGERSHRPVFILGMPRSGSTLIEQILASHPLVHAIGEQPILQTVIDAMGTARDPLPHLAYPEFVPALDAAAVKEMGTRYLAEIKRLAPAGKTRVTDKSLWNYSYIGLIHMVLPNARIIHAVRDPVDTCIACFEKLFAVQQTYSYDLAELGRYNRRYRRLMAHWHHVLPPGRILDVRYEDVVADLEGQARRIIAYCGLEWDARCLAFHKTTRPVATASQMQVRQPIYSSSVGRWRVYEPFLGPLLAELDD